MKRLICFLLVCAMFAAALPVFAESDYVFCQTFAGFATNSVKTGRIDAVADEIRVINIADADKGLKLSAERRRKIAAAAEFTHKLTDKAVISFDVDMSGKYQNAALAVYDSRQEAIELMQLAPDIRLCDGKQIYTSGLGMRKFDVVIDMGSSVCSVYINGKCLLYRWYIAALPKDIAKAELTGVASKAGAIEMIIGGVWAYGGDKVRLRSALPKEVYNNASQEIEYSESNDTVGSNVYLSRTFDEQNLPELDGLTVNSTTTVIEVAEEKSSGNKYLSLVKNQTESGYADVRKTFSDRFVVEMDFGMGDTMFIGALYLIGSNINEYLLRFNTDGSVTLGDGTRICILKKNEWQKISLAVDLNTHLVDVYLNGNLIYKEAELDNMNLSAPSIARLYVQAGSNGAGGELRIDNWRIYDGISPHSEDNSKTDSSQPNNSQQNNGKPTQSSMMTLLGSEDDKVKTEAKAYIAADGAYLIAGGEKTELPESAYIKDNVFMVPLRSMCDALGKSLNADADGNNITVGSMVIKGNEIYLGSEKLPLAAENKNGTLFVPAEYFAAYAANTTVSIYEHGLAVFGGESLDAEEEKKEWAEVFYRRPDADKVLEDYKNNSEGMHPRVVVTNEQPDRIIRLKDSDEYAKMMYNAVVDSADRYAKREPARREDYSNAVRDSDIALNVAREIRNRFYNMGFAYLLTGNDKYAEPVWNQIIEASNFSDWGEQSSFLAVGEMLGAFAVAYDWLYPCWSDEQRSFIADTMINKGLIYSQRAYRGTLNASNPTNNKWYNMESNWNQVCNSGTAMAACALMDEYPDFCSQIVSDAIRSNEATMAAFYPFGSWAEGPGYWSYALRYLTTMYASLDCTLGTDYGMLKAPGVDNTFNFNFDVCGPSGVTNNYHDGDEGSVESSYLWWFATKFNDINYYNERLFQMKEYVTSTNVYDAMFYNPEYQFDSQSETRQLDCYYTGEELVSLRSAWRDPYATWVSFHGGINDMDMHGHIDTGTFILEMLGQRWSKDLGADTYSSEYWGTKTRPTYYRIRAEGHNTIVLNPDAGGGQVLDEEGMSPVIRNESKPNGAISVLDMTNAYSENAQSALRGFYLCDGRRNVIIRDELRLLGETDIYWFMHTDAEIDIKDKNTAILTKNGVSIKCVMSSNIDNAEFMVLDATPLETSPNNSNNSPNKGISRLTVKATGKNYAYIQVKFMDVNAPEANNEPEIASISEWTIPEGEPVPLPLLQGVSINGEEISDFEPNKKSYQIYMPDVNEEPIVEAICGEGQEYVIEKSADGAVIRTFNSDAPNLFTSIGINFVTLPNRDDIDGYEQCRLRNVTSSSAQTGAEDYFAVDGDVTTRWAANGEQWICLEFLETESVDAIGVYMMDSKSRTAQVKLEISVDAENWQTVFDGTLGGERDGYDFIEAGGAQVKYLRLTGNGNSVNEWNSVMELTALKKSGR